MKKGDHLQFIGTAKGVMCCNVPDYVPATYQGLKKNCGRKPSATALAAMKKEAHEQLKQKAS